MSTVPRGSVAGSLACAWRPSPPDLAGRSGRVGCETSTFAGSNGSCASAIQLADCPPSDATLTDGGVPLPTSLIVRARRPAIALAAAAFILSGLAPAAMAADGLTVTTPYPSIAVAPGSNASFDLTIDTDTAGTVALSVSGVPTGWKATLHGGGFVVNGVTATPSKAATARLDVEVPADTTATSGAVKVNARLGSKTDSLAISIAVDAAVS